MTKNELYWEIDVRKQSLKATDYKAIKHSEGLISDDDYEVTKQQRQEWRDQINEYETMIAEGNYEEPEISDDFINDAVVDNSRTDGE